MLCFKNVSENVDLIMGNRNVFEIQSWRVKRNEESAFGLVEIVPWWGRVEAQCTVIQWSVTPMRRVITMSHAWTAEIMNVHVERMVSNNSRTQWNWSKEWHMGNERILIHLSLAILRELELKRLHTWPTSYGDSFKDEQWRSQAQKEVFGKKWLE